MDLGHTYRRRKVIQRLLAAGLVTASARALAEVAQVEAAVEPIDETDIAAEYDPLDVALNCVGLPYIWGSVAGRSYFGLEPQGFDCSGFVCWTMLIGQGVFIPAQTALAWLRTVVISDPQRGDLAFYNMNQQSARLQHVAIVLDEGETIIQAGGVRNDVNIASAYAVGRPTFRRIPA